MSQHSNTRHHHAPGDPRGRHRAAQRAPGAPGPVGAARAGPTSRAPLPRPATTSATRTGRYLSREAAGYRRRLRETEAERDQLRAQLDRLQTAEVERLASAAGLAVAGDVWMHGAALDTLRAEDGSIDHETVTGLVADILRDRPGLRRGGTGDIGIGRGAAAAGTTTAPKVGLSALLKRGAQEKHAERPLGDVLLYATGDFAPERPNRPPWHQPRDLPYEHASTGNVVTVPLKCADTAELHGLERPSYEQDWECPEDWTRQSWGVS